MKIVTTQEKFKDLLEKLVMKDMFPSSVICVKDGKLFSIQKEQHARGLRFLNVKSSFFEKLEGNESIEIDAQRTLDIVKSISPGTKLIVETKDNKLIIKKLMTDDKGNVIGEKGFTAIGWKEPETVITSLDQVKVHIKDGIPTVGDTKVQLQNHLTVDLSDFKELAGYGSSLKTEFYKFSTNSNKLDVKIGGIHDFSDYDVEHPKSEIKAGSDLEVIFTYGIPQIAESFRENVNVRTKSNCPGWFYESTKDYVLAVLIPPYIP